MMTINISEKLNAAVANSVSDGRLSRPEFIAQLVSALKKKGLDAKAKHNGKCHYIACEMDKGEVPGFTLTFESESTVLFMPNEYSASSHGREFCVSRGKDFSMLNREKKGQLEIVEYVGGWIGANSTTERLKEFIHHREAPKALVFA